MPRFYHPPLDGREEDPFARDGDDKLIRRAYFDLIGLPPTPPAALTRST